MWKRGLPTEYPCLVFLPHLKVFKKVIYLQDFEELEGLEDEVSHWISMPPDDEIAKFLSLGEITDESHV